MLEVIENWVMRIAANAVGTVAFVFDGWTPNEAVNLSANPGYWHGEPSIDPAA